MTKLQIINKGCGFIKLPNIGEEFYNLIISSIEIHLQKQLKTLNPNDNLIKLKKSILENYSLINESVWSDLFSKSYRSLGQAEANKLSPYFIKYLSQQLNTSIELSDDLNLGYPCFSIRLVRPQNYSDIGPIHADQWFIDIGATRERFGKQKSELLKFWLPLVSSKSKSNLLVLPYSQRNPDKYKYDSVETEYGKKPKLITNITPNEMTMIDNKPGEPVIFHMLLMHGGALNTSRTYRLSLEFEFFATI